MTSEIPEQDVWGPYVNYDDVARLQYGRMFWRDPVMRQRLLKHWLDARHPYRERFLENSKLVERALETDLSDGALDAEFRNVGTSLRAVVREIPPVFGSFF
jgi:hypothetical protein